MNGSLIFRAAMTCTLGLMVLPAARARAEDAKTIEDRLSQSAKYLASDELEGRGVGTKGIDLAADYIAAQFRQTGLKTDAYEGDPFQKFKMTVGSSLGGSNSLSFVGPSAEPAQEPRRIDLKLGETFRPLALSGSGQFDLPLMFVGYGITGKDENYDDYAGVDVKDKAVVILRHEPQQDNPHSVFDGTKTSRHAPFSRKVSNAYEHSAAAVIFCNDEFDLRRNRKSARDRWQAAVDQLAEANAKFKTIDKPSADEQEKHEQQIRKLAEDLIKSGDTMQAAEDPLLGFEGAGSESEGRNFPILFCTRGALEPVIQAALHKKLSELEAEIDKGPQPRSAALDGWRAAGQTSVKREEVEVKNVVGVLEGEGPHASEVIVLGAHYDHLGFGGPGSAAPGVHEIHNGADDNGSGSAVLIEVARELAGRGKKLPRTLVFIAFTGEERGLVGSARYVRNPLFPLESTIAMLNLDMVGRLEGDKLIVHGTGTAKGFEPLVDRFGKQFGFEITKKPSGFGPSDHSSFYGAKVPVLFFFTGSHKDYHRPTDDFEKLNIGGMRRVAQMVADIAVALAEAPERPGYEEVKGGGETLGGGDRPYFGSIPDFARDETGYALTGVTKDGPAERAGIKGGDLIIQFGDSKIGNLEDFDSALRKYKAGDKVPILLTRAGQQVKLEVTLDPPR